LLNEHKIPFTYRDYTKEPLSEEELRSVFSKLGVEPRALLRARDAKKHDVAKELDADALIAAMAEHPRLLQRPIGVLPDRAVVGRPIENLLTLASSDLES